MKTRILPKTAAFCGVCLGVISWAGVAAAGSPDTAVVSVPSSETSMKGTTYGTSLSPGARIACELWGDAGPAFAFSQGHCYGEDPAGDDFSCWTDDPILIHAIDTMPDYQRLSVFASAAYGECVSIYSYRGSRYLPPGSSGGGHPEVDVTSLTARGSFYGARVSADSTQYAICTVYDSATYSYVSCQAKDVEGDYFYCSSTHPHIMATVRNFKNYSEFYFVKNALTSDCQEILATNGSDGLP